MSKRVVHYFVSYAHKDERLPGKLVAELDKQLGACRNYEFKRWQDTDILVGENWHHQIQDALDECDFGLLLVSPAFLSSHYIDAHELPRFVKGQKPCIPVVLHKIDFEQQDLKGLEYREFFLYRSEGANAPRAFAEQNTAKLKEGFAFALFQKINTRLDEHFAPSRNLTTPRASNQAVQREPSVEKILYHRSEPSVNLEGQIILRCRAMERFALTWLLTDQLPSGGWGRSLVPWMKANWKGYSIAPDLLMEDEGGFESSVLAFHVLYHLWMRSKELLPREVLSRFKTYLDRNQDPKSGGFGTRSMSREGVELSVRLRHTALGAYALLLLNQIEHRTVEQQITRTLRFLFRQQRENYSDDRNGCLLYALLNFLSFNIAAVGNGSFEAYRPPADIAQALHDWRQEHEPTMRRQFLRTEYQAFGNTGALESCDPYLAPYSGFPRMLAYTFLTTCQFTTEQMPREVHQRLCAGLVALVKDYRNRRDVDNSQPPADPLKPPVHGIPPWKDADSPDVGTTALLLAALSSNVLRAQLKILAAVGEKEIQESCAGLQRDLSNLFDRYLVEPRLFEFTHAPSFAFLLLGSDSSFSAREMQDTATKVAALRFDAGLSEKSLNDFVEENIFGKGSDLPTHVFAASLSRLLLDMTRPGRYPESHLDLDNVANRHVMNAIVDKTLQVYQDPVFVEAFCSVWASRPMVNVANTFKSILQQRQGRTVLDVGSGPGQNARLLQEAGMDVTLLDNSMPMLERAKQLLQVTGGEPKCCQLDIRQLLTLGPTRFDGIWCSGTLIHFPEPLAREIVGAFANLLVENGVLMVNCAIDNPRLVAKDGRFFTYWRDQEHFSRVLTAAGFEIVEVITSFVRPNTHRESSVRIRWDNFVCVRSRAEADVGRIGQLTSTAYDLIVRRFVAQHEKTYNRAIVALVSDELLKRRLGSAILDAGCGPGHYSGAFAEKGFNVTGIDLSRVMIEVAKRKYSSCAFAIQDLSDLHFENGSFDCVFCMAAFQHIPLEAGVARKTLEGFRCVLKPGGLIMLDVQLGRETGFEPDGRFTQGYRSKDEAATLLEESGFRVLRQNPWSLKPKENTFQREIELRFCDFLAEKV